jgi:hypothetical protein
MAQSGSALEFGDRDKEVTMCMILFALTDNYVPALYICRISACATTVAINAASAKTNSACVG